MNKLSVGIGSLVLLLSPAIACRADDTEQTTDAAAFTPPPPLFQPFTVGAEVGTTGVGAAADWRFLNHFGVGVAFDTFIFNYHGTIEDADYHLRLHLQSEPLTLNVYPWKRSSFHVSIGALFNQNRLSGTSAVGSGETVTIDGVTYNGPVDLSVSVKQQPVNPYLTVGGNLYFDHKHHWSLGGQLGIVYTGQPRTTFTATAPPGEPTIPESAQQAEQAKIQSYANRFKFWPVFKVSLNYSF